MEARRWYANFSHTFLEFRMCCNHLQMFEFLDRHYSTANRDDVNLILRTIRDEHTTCLNCSNLDGGLILWRIPSFNLEPTPMAFAL
jgi:hypothetical protein